MTTNGFSLKKFECESHRIHSTISSLEDQWLEALLLRCNVPKLTIDKKKSGTLSNSHWREYLFTTFQLNIYKNLLDQSVRVYKVSLLTNENTLIAEWNKPEVVIKTSGKDRKYELRLKYWQII